MGAQLRVIAGPDCGRTYPLVVECVQLGRHSANAIALNDVQCSRKHAELRPTSTSWTLYDLGSGNGTRVNGVGVTEVTLRTGDLVQLGQTTLRFEDAAPAEPDGEATRIVWQADPDEGDRIERALPVEGIRDEPPPLASLAVLYEASTLISTELDLPVLLAKVLELLLRSTPAEQGCVLLLEGELLLPTATRSRTGGGDVRLSRTVADYVLANRRGVLLHDAPADERFRDGASIARHRLRQILCVPMSGRHDTVGTIFLVHASNQPAHRFTEEHLKLTMAVAHQCALAVEEQRHYAAMIHAERLAAVGQTIAGLSHHIKNIMQGVRFGTEMVREAIGPNGVEEALLRRGWRLVERNQQRIDDLILDMLNVSKDREPLLEPVEIQGVIREVLDSAQGQASDKAVALVHHTAGLPAVLADATALHRALLNVVMNAIDAVAGQADATVKISASVDDTLAWITVCDNGTGVPADIRDEIFKPFVSTKGSRGTGLGLPASRKTLREHGGDIAVTDAPDGGAQFTLHWPRGT